MTNTADISSNVRGKTEISDNKSTFLDTDINNGLRHLRFVSEGHNDGHSFYKINTDDDICGNSIYFNNTFKTIEIYNDSIISSMSSPFKFELTDKDNLTTFGNNIRDCLLIDNITNTDPSLVTLSVGVNGITKESIDFKCTKNYDEFKVIQNLSSNKVLKSSNAKINNGNKAKIDGSYNFQRLQGTASIESISPNFFYTRRVH